MIVFFNRTWFIYASWSLQACIKYMDLLMIYLTFKSFEVCLCPTSCFVSLLDNCNTYIALKFFTIMSICVVPRGGGVDSL
jgi:hypothetical protein